MGQAIWTGSDERKDLERSAIAGESPLREAAAYLACIPSSAGHVEPCVNPAGPPAKAKHSPETDSEPVP